MSQEKIKKQNHDVEQTREATPSVEQQEKEEGEMLKKRDEFVVEDVSGK